MKTEDNFSMKRLTAILSMMVGLLGLSIFWAIWYHFSIDQIITFCVISLLFFPVFFLFLYMERMQGHLLHNPDISYQKISKGFLVMLILYLVYSFLPAYSAAVMIPVMFLVMISNTAVGIVCGLFLDLLLCMISAANYYELAAYVILTLMGALMALLFEQKRYRIYMNIIIFSISMSVPGLFYYMGSFKMNYRIFIYGAIGGVVTCLVFLIFYDKMLYQAENEITLTLQEIIAPEFPLVKEIQNYSEMDYVHAVNVSRVAYQCAVQVGADANVAAAAGFYYRLGKLEGEPFIDNGVIRAKQNCFPASVVEILSEYNGDQKMPSTKESAIVHMVDAVITKFELIDKDTLSSTWNHDIVIYQTLNEKSASGLYDESGLSMNLYLKIREYMVKGVMLF
jgi:membrane-associated HD superfamily phosphohydrolase